MNHNIMSLYDKFKNETYEVSNLEFEIMQAKLNLTFNLNDYQLKLFEQYEMLNLKLLKKNENLAFKFAVNQLKSEQNKKAP